MMINRELYMRKVRPFIDKSLIKVIKGVRRCGKSVMIQLIQAELKKVGIKEQQMLVINFEDMSFASLTDATSLHYEVMRKYSTNPKLKYLFFDEIQEVKEWEKCINSLLSKGQFDIYITGSNANLLSGELATFRQDGMRKSIFIHFPLMSF